MENYQQDLDQNKKGNNLWMSILIIIVVAIIIFFIVRTRTAPTQVSEDEKTQILNELRDSRQSGPAVELSEEQKAEILSDIQISRDTQPNSLTEEERQSILNDLRN